MRGSGPGRRSLAGALLLVATSSACVVWGDQEDPSVSVTAEPPVRLVSTSGDVFAWEQRIEGAGACEEVVALVDGAEREIDVEVREPT